MRGDWTGDMNDWAWLVVALSLALAVAETVAAFIRVRRQIASKLMIAAVAPLAVAIVAQVVAIASSFATVETLRAPTPKDLAHGLHAKALVMALGVAGTLLCFLGAFLAFQRSRPVDDDAPSV